MFKLEEINGFQSPGELARFKIFLDSHILSGDLREIPADPQYNYGVIVGGRWFQELSNGNIWRLIEPDPPSAGMFERVRT